MRKYPIRRNCGTVGCKNEIGINNKSGYCFPCVRRMNFMANKGLGHGNAKYCSRWKNGEYQNVTN